MRPFTNPCSLLILLGMSAIFSTANAAGAVRPVEGDAVTASGHPLANATLYFPPVRSRGVVETPPGEQNTVVTDTRGHFVWAAPPASVSALAGDPPRCVALAADRSSADFTPWPDLGQTAPDPLITLMDHETAPCETKWTDGSLAVTVPDVGVVSMMLCGPDGDPIAGRDVQIASYEPDTTAVVVYTLRPDSQGRIHTRWFTGRRRVFIFAAGLGFGSTGVFQVLPDKSIAAPIPAFVPFAEISGSVPLKLQKPGAMVHIHGSSNSATSWRAASAPVRGDGSFVIHDVIPEMQVLQLLGGQGDAQLASVWLRPGERKHVVFRAAPTPSVPPAQLPAPRKPKTMLSGVVTNAQGAPVAGADVYVIYDHWYMFPQRQSVVRVQTDAQGHYVSVSPGSDSIAGRPAHVY
ncbi:MAG: carboxypeptidase-like regulatory domain-containing protein, partial [Capsulimonas sp.]|uniref:carboxypeptidase-like regulatory domain-containing protein n=1 Tax=Capsulimonas sp. TaxID=2494211 RepID=UPI003265C3B7